MRQLNNRTIKQLSLSDNNKKQALFVFCDGGARDNPGPAAGAFVVKDNKGKILYQEGRYFGQATNNQAEYKAVILALEWLVKQPSTIRQSPAAINFYLDSRLVVNQLSGHFKIKNRQLQRLAIKVREKEKALDIKVFYHLIKREKNSEADKLLNQVLARHT